MAKKIVDDSDSNANNSDDGATGENNDTGSGYGAGDGDGGGGDSGNNTDSAGDDNEEYKKKFEEATEKIDQLMAEVVTLREKIEEPKKKEDQIVANEQLSEMLKKDPLSTIAVLIQNGVSEALKPYQEQIAKKEIEAGMREIKELPGYSEYESEIVEAITKSPDVRTVDQVKEIAFKIIGSRIPTLEEKIREDERKKLLKKIKDEGIAITEEGGAVDSIFSRGDTSTKKPEDILLERISNTGPRDPFQGLV